VLRKLRAELSRVQELRSKLEKDVAGLRQMRESFKAFEPHIVMIREVTENQAEKEIVDYLQSHDHADTGELVEKLGIDVDLVLSVVQRLKEQGKVERVDSHQSGRRD
jgi:ribosomal protein S25